MIIMIYDISSVLPYSSSKWNGKINGHREKNHESFPASFPILKFLQVFQALMYEEKCVNI